MSDSINNYFVHSTAAERYAGGRPYFHPRVIERIYRHIAQGRVSRALDVACGTGQSTRALAALADHVDAIDISPEMLAQAEPLANVRYKIARAEALPFVFGIFKLVTVGLAIHWFDEERFLREAHRVLRPSGWLAIFRVAVVSAAQQ